MIELGSGVLVPGSASAGAARMISAGLTTSLTSYAASLTEHLDLTSAFGEVTTPLADYAASLTEHLDLTSAFGEVTTPLADYAASLTEHLDLTSAFGEVTTPLADYAASLTEHLDLGALVTDPLGSLRDYLHPLAEVLASEIAAAAPAVAEAERRLRRALARTRGLAASRTSRVSSTALLVVGLTWAMQESALLDGLVADAGGAASLVAILIVIAQIIGEGKK
ncbi:hypothetical protein DQ244_04185 [Blastococcus sp. TBT05-19]|uniref:hypothetical protein n=1 Tax=Blastococcus sp. TBT05-19 TaxID=2250581 RepID=UPI000DEBD45E|nr:hypothetical protein [Blastococcus sp. TBT05-19]RBY94512.1 hypothetical protein DQ244_04185 [Blastococcus sp. TBT05-19]